MSPRTRSTVAARPNRLPHALLLGAGLLIAANVHAQKPSPPLGIPAGASEPAWTKRLNMPDGRTFVSDGAMALDAAIARPATLPSIVIPAATSASIDRMLNGAFASEVRSAQLSPNGRYYATPDDVRLNTGYIDYLRRAVGGHRLRFRVRGAAEAVVITVDGKPVGVLMPMAK